MNSSSGPCGCWPPSQPCAASPGALGLPQPRPGLSAPAPAHPPCHGAVGAGPHCWVVPVGLAQGQGPALPTMAITASGLCSDPLPWQSRGNCSHQEVIEIRLSQENKYPNTTTIIIIIKNITHRVLIFGMWLKLVTGMRVMLLLLRVLLGEKKKKRDKRIIDWSIIYISSPTHYLQKQAAKTLGNASARLQAVRHADPYLRQLGMYHGRQC